VVERDDLVIVASDRDLGAVRAATANAERAGVNIDVRHAALTKLQLPPGPGAIVTNPPYGTRIGEAAKLRDLYDAWATWMSERAAGWSLTMVDGDRDLTSRLRMAMVERARTSNGGLDIRFQSTQG
jgi:putative N6-adenine-specific DNA methylase